MMDSITMCAREKGRYEPSTAVGCGRASLSNDHNTHPYTKLKLQHCPFGWSCLFIESETDYLRSILLCIKILRYRVPLRSGMYGIVSTVAEDSLGLLLPFKESRGSDGGPAHLMSIPHSPFLQHPLEDT